MHQRLLNIEKAALVVVDVQEAFRTVIVDFPMVVSRIAAAIRGFQILGLPILVSEQYPEGLGPTAEELSFSLTEEIPIFKKTTFSACGADGFTDALKDAGTTHIVICGLETHICVNQTAHDLLDLGFEVHLMADCVASRYEADKNAALLNLQGSGVVRSSVEMALFELMRDSRHPKFKEVQSLIK